MFSLVVTFSTLFRTALSLHFGAILGSPGATMLPLGCPWGPLEALLELSWAPVGLTGPSLGAFWDLASGIRESGVWGRSRFWNLESGVYNLESGVCNLEPGVWGLRLES